ncbi:hypothetical protein B0H21DRAFT_693809 [Amylocystis lapponica]|nr:hypothetical protein B0H21DRAFT_693809 [Amylocystis lapponica]
MAAPYSSALPPPVVQASVSSGRRGKKKSARVDGGLRVHWDRFKRKMGTGTAPSTSTAIDADDSGDGSCGPRLHHRMLHNEDPDMAVDEVVVDREWSDDIKSSISHSEHAASPEKSGGSNHLGTSTDRESLAIHPTGFWVMCPPLLFIRWRIWPWVYAFFSTHFMDEKSEMHYNKENWFLRKNLALWSSSFLIVNWVLAIAFIARPIELADKIFYYGVAPALTFPVFPMVLYDFPRDRSNLYQVFLVFSTWSWSIYQVLFIYLCGYYLSASHFTCGSKDFLTTFYYTSALQTISLFGLKLHRFPAMLGAASFFIISCAIILPVHVNFVRNLVNFVLFQTFLLYTHYMRENAERRLYTLRDQLKIQFRATQKAQVNERKAADSKRRLTSGIAQVRVPLNTALLAVQNMEAYGSVAKAQEIEFKALEGSLSMMSKVLNDVLDFNRMDSGRFESVLKPYAFHQVMRSMFVPLRMATDARGLEFTTDMDPKIDEVARRALCKAMGDTDAAIAQRLEDHPAETGIVVGDETRLRQVITNLASNACKFTPTGGRLHISTRLIVPSVSGCEDSAQSFKAMKEGTSDISYTTDGEPAPIPSSQVKQGLTPEMPHRLSATHLTQHNLNSSKPPPLLDWIVVRIEVTDTGYGIRPGDMVESKLFTAFNQTEQGRLQGGKGTGLGLALVRQIVKLTGGRLGVQSKVNKGSTFWVELPLGVGSKVLPGLTTPSENGDGAMLTSSLSSPKSLPACRPPMLHDTPDRRAAQIVSSNSTSALHGIMEQGGLVEISAKRGEHPAVLTRTIGDPSTGTTAEVEESSSSPSASTEQPPGLPTENSGETVRPRLSSLPKPPQFTSVDTPLSSPASAVSAGSSTLPNGATSMISLSNRENPLRVLVVDDDLLTRKLMSRMLTRIGCKVNTAENGEVALDMILGAIQGTPSSENTGSAGLSMNCDSEMGDEPRYAVVFLDNQMPVLSGLDVVMKLRELGRHDFVVGVTGNALLADQREYLEAGADHVLTKPVLEKSLKNMLAIADERRKRRSSIPELHSPAPASPA